MKKEPAIQLCESTAFTIGSSLLDRELKLAREFSCGGRPILQYVRIDVKGREATITATNLDSALSRSFDIDDAPPEPFAVLVHAENLGKIVHACPGELLMLTAKSDGNPDHDVIIRHSEPTKATTNIPAGAITSTYTLYGKPLADFPTPAMPADDCTLFRIGSAALLEGLRWATPACKGDGKYGLIFRQQDGGLSIGATNGKMLATTGLIEATNAAMAEKPIVVPFDTADRLMAVLGREDETEIEVRVEGGVVSFAGPKWRMTANLRGEFPAMAWELLGREEKHFATANAGDFAKAVQSVAKIAKCELVNVEIGKSGWVVRAEDPGRAEKAIAGKSNASDLMLRVPTDCLRAWLKRVPKADWIAVCANDTYEPTVWMCQSKPKAAWVIAGQRKPVEPAAVPQPAREAA